MKKCSADLRPLDLNSLVGERLVLALGVGHRDGDLATTLADLLALRAGMDSRPSILLGELTCLRHERVLGEELVGAGGSVLPQNLVTQSPANFELRMRALPLPLPAQEVGEPQSNEQKPEQEQKIHGHSLCHSRTSFPGYYILYQIMCI